MAEPIAPDVTLDQFFEQLLPAGFAEQQAANPNTESVTMAFHITGDPSADWTVNIEGPKMTCVKGLSPALITYTLSSADFRDAMLEENGAKRTLIFPERRGGRGTGALKALRGTMALNLTRPGGDPFKIEMSFNGPATPRTTMTVALADWIAIGEGKMNGQEAFMTGKMRVEGDMGFMMQVGMATQS